MKDQDRDDEDAALVVRARAGDREAFGVLVTRHQRAALRTAYAIGGSESEAEDVSQEAFVKAFRSLRRFEDGRPLRPWLMQIVANEARNRRRSRGRRERLAGGRPRAPSASLPPTAIRGVGALLSVFRAEVNEAVIQKTLEPGTTYGRVAVGNHLAVWLAGSPHLFFYQGADGPASRAADAAAGRQHPDLDRRAVHLSPEAFGSIEDHPMTLQMIEYLPPDHPTSYRVRTLDLTTGDVGLPLNLRDKATRVDQTMAGTSRTQVYAAGQDLLFTLYQPVSTDGGAWEYGFVHTLATAWGGVWCIDLPDVLGLEDHRGTLALSPDDQLLYVATGAGRIGTIHTSDPQALAVDRTANLGVAADEQPVMVAGSDCLWVGLGRRLLAVDPTSLEAVARAELPAAVTAMALERVTHELVGADDGGHLRRWVVDDAGQLTATASIPLPAGLGPVARIVL